MKRWYCGAVFVLLVFGAIRQPLERGLAAELKAGGFHEDRMPDGAMRAQLGQLGAAAALGGFRSFLATLYELRAVTAYSNSDYVSVETNYHLATQLQPKESGYWEMAAWMLDTNARRHYLTFDRENSPAERQVLARLGVRRGRKFLDDGLSHNPDDYRLHRALGNHLVQREGNFCQAAEAFEKAAALVQESSAAWRHHVVNLALCSGKEREAYAKMRALGDKIMAGESVIPPSMLPASIPLYLRYLEGELGIPEAQRFQGGFDFMGLYRRLRARWRPGDYWENYTKLHRIRLHRLEEVLGIPEDQRISR